MLRDAFLRNPILNLDITMLPVYVRSPTSDPDGVLVTGIFITDDERFMLSIITKQKKREILKIVNASRSLAVLVQGSWSKVEFTGNSGEVYRPLVGRIYRLPRGIDA
mgnify:CR=1 FL=1